ncbi:MAG: DUF86 domain-containing protein [Candidatus Thorarchaeota archaeon]|nr:DUF86 domain-containing protein [Candidatus Thorarchaeota archaeon]
MTKIAHARDRLNLTRRWLEDEYTLDDQKTVLAIEKAVQETIEATTDLLSMVLKDTSQPPLDDHTNIDRAVRLGVMSHEIGLAMHEANGLRNRLVHTYNGIDLSRVFESIERLIPKIKECLEMIEAWLHQKSMI